MRRQTFVIQLLKVIGPAAALLLLAVVPAAAQVIDCPPAACIQDGPCPTLPPGCIPVPPPPGGVFTNPAWLKISYHRVDVTIENQIAATDVDMEFVNEGEGLAEGTFIFPLPKDAAVDKLVMTVNGLPIEARILPADQARSIYNAIVRQYRDPALLEYVGSSAIQASVFPIPPGETRRIQIRYTHILEADNGLLHYVYPLKVTNLLSPRPVESMRVTVTVRGADAISSIYSPSHAIAISRDDDDRGFRASYESGRLSPNDDFSLYYGLASGAISVNLLTYRESATEDGFFMLLVQPPVKLPREQIIARDIIIVLDQSGSMQGEKWDQARTATEYVLRRLNPSDRFNLILFSSGWRLFSSRMEPPAQAEDAIDWVRSQEALGATDINGALLTALDMVEAERPATILFLTDGLPTEGVTNTTQILANLEQASKPNARIFSFGVGDDVDTFLLDAIVRDHRGAGSYVRPGQRIDEEVASLYSKISAPVLTDITLDFDTLRVQDVYPRQPLPDLFAGTQLTIVGRYRGEADGQTLTLSGLVNGQPQTFVYSGQNFPGRAGGEPFIARLWATRRIGDLLNTIRLGGEDPELVDAVVRLSVRYGIITPYTSFLIEEDDILSAQGRERAAMALSDDAQALSALSSGAAAVDAASTFGTMAEAEAPMPAPMPTMTLSPQSVPPGQIAPLSPAEPVNPVQTIGGKTFILRDGVWTDTTFEPDTMQTQPVVFLSDEYFALLDEKPELGAYFALGERIIVVFEGTAYEVVAE